MKYRTHLFFLLFTLLILSSTVHADLSTPLVAYFYNDCTTDEYSTYDLTTSGSPTTSATVKVGTNSCDFEFSTSDYVYNNAVANLDFADGDHSICTWIKPESDSAYFVFTLANTGSATPYHILYSNDATDILTDFLNQGGVGSNTVAGPDLTGDTAWHHVCAVSSSTGCSNLTVDATNYGQDCSPALSLADADQVFQISANNGANYWDGLMNQFLIYNYKLTMTEIAQLYNSGNGYDPLASAGSLTLNTSLINNTNSTSNPFTFTINGSVVDTTDIWNVSFYVNGSLQTTVVNTALNNTNIQFNYSDGNGAYLFNVTAINNESIVDSFTRNVFIDTIQPKIQIISGLTNNTVITKTDGANFKINYSDTNLEAINFTIYRLLSNGSIDIKMNNTFVQSITTGEYIYNFTDSFLNSNWLNARDYAVVLSAWDGHTDNNLRFTPYVDFNNVLHYGGLSFYCDDTAIMSYEKTTDSIKPKISFNTPRRKQACYYETTGEFNKVKRQNGNYPIWYVDIANRFWIDEKDGNFESNLVSPTKLKITLNFDTNRDYWLSESFGDLNFNTLTYYFTVDSFTTYYANKINISDTLISGTSWQLVSNTSFNLTATRDLFYKLFLNSEKLLGADSHTLSINVTLDGTQLQSKVLRTMNSAGQIGVSGIIGNFSAGLGSHNLAVYFKETGSGNIQLSNIDFVLLNFRTQNNESICTPIVINDDTTFSSTSFVPVLNFSTDNTYPAETYLEYQISINTTGTDTVDLFLQDTDDFENGTLIRRYMSSASSVGSVYNTFIDAGLNANKNYSIFAKSTNGETIGLNGQLNGLCLRTINNTKINYFQGINTSVPNTFNAGRHVLTSNQITLKNGTSLLLSASTVLQSTTGLQTPTINVSRVGGTCSLVKDRTLSSNNDIGNAFLTCTPNSFSVGDSPTFEFAVEVPTGESLTEISDVVNAFEIVALDLTTLNIAPVISFSSDLGAITVGTDASLTVTGTDLNGDSINLNISWYVNGVLKTTDNATISAGGSHEFTLNSGNYVAGQFVNATITSDDGTDVGNILYSATQEVQSATTTTDLLLASINATLSELNTTQNESKGDFTMLWIIIAVIFFLIAGLFTRMWALWSVSGVFVMLGGLKMGQIFVTNGQAFYQATTYIFLILGGLMIFGGMVLQLFIKQLLGKGDEFYNLKY